MKIVFALGTSFESVLKYTEGVFDVNVNFVNSSVIVEYEEGLSSKTML